MNRLFHIAAREYLENVKTKAFLLAVLMTPLLMGISILLPPILARAKTEPRRIAVADVTGSLGPDVVRRLAARKAPDEKTNLYDVETVAIEGQDDAARDAAFARARPDLEARVLDGRLFAYVVIRPSAVDRTATGLPPSQLRASNLLAAEVIQDVGRVLSDASNEQIIAKSSVPRAVADQLTRRVPFSPEDVKARGSGEMATIAAIVVPIAFVFLLFLTIVTVSQMLIMSTIEEKSNRVIEVLLSSVSPSQLMTGKILGTCAVGLTLMTIWTGGGLAGLAISGQQLVTGGQLLLSFVYYLLGFVLFASLMVAAGSACNTLKEAQNLLAPVMAVLSLSMIFVVATGRDPDGALAHWLSFVPVLTPFLMMMRVSSTPPAPPLEIAASIAVLGLSAWLSMRVAARVFRVGVLMYGKPPSLRELWRWMWAR